MAFTMKYYMFITILQSYFRQKKNNVTLKHVLLENHNDSKAEKQAKPV